MSYHYPRHNLMKDQNLLIAAKCGDVNLVRDLINAGYPISHKDKYGKTALHHAVEGNCVPDLFCYCLFSEYGALSKVSQVNETNVPASLGFFRVCHNVMFRNKGINKKGHIWICSPILCFNDLKDFVSRLNISFGRKRNIL